MDCLDEFKAELVDEVGQRGEGEGLEGVAVASHGLFVDLEMVFERFGLVEPDGVGVEDIKIQQGAGFEDAVEFDEIKEHIVVEEVDEDGGRECFVDRRVCDVWDRRVLDVVKLGVVELAQFVLCEVEERFVEVEAMDFLGDLACGAGDEAAPAAKVDDGVVLVDFDKSADFFSVLVSAVADLIDAIFRVLAPFGANACGEHVSHGVEIVFVPCRCDDLILSGVESC